MPDLIPVNEVEQKGAPEARAVLRWVKEYLGTKDAQPELARTYVCPFIPGAIEQNSLWFATEPDVIDAAGAEGCILECAEQFHGLEPQSGPTVRNKAIVAIFPSIGEAQAAAAIDEVQKKVKPWFVENLMMIGELHPWNRTEAKGFEGKGIFPNRTPSASLAIRTIVMQDKKFLYSSLGPGTSWSDSLQFWKYRRAWLRAMLKWGNEEWIKRYRRLAEEDIELASEAIAQSERLLQSEP
jgi:uncharacterized protein DUF6875